MSRPITAFNGAYFYLSNFYVAPIPMPDESMPYAQTVEHRFQALKSLDPEQIRWVLDSPSASASKQRGRQVTLRPDWERIKDEVMLESLRAKFTLHNNLRLNLLATAPAELIEGNNWGDTYWGFDTSLNRGENLLGRLLMQVREELK